MPFNSKNDGIDLEFLEPLDEGLGHSFCYVRPLMFESPAITPSTSERFTVDSSTLDSETLSGSFRHDSFEDPLGLHKSNKCFPETTFKTISGASVSANVSTARTGNQSALFATDVQEPAASFESTSSFAAIPLQPAPHGSGPLNGFMSGPLERGFVSGPLDRGGGFMSGPIEKGVMSGPIDSTDKSNFSAPLSHCQRQRAGLHHLMRSVSGPMKNTLSRTFSKHSVGSGWLQRPFFHQMTQLSWHAKEKKSCPEFSRKFLEGGLSPTDGEYRNNHNLQWAHGKAGEDRVHVVLSEEHGWLFIGIYDGFSGPDAPDFLMSYLYRAIDKELEGLLWDYEDGPPDNSLKPVPDIIENAKISSGCCRQDQPNIYSSEVISCCSMDSCKREIIECQHSGSNVEVKNEVRTSFEHQSPNCVKSSFSGTSSVPVPMKNVTGKARRSKQLYELLEMDRWDGQGSMSVLVIGKQRKHSSDCQLNLASLDSQESSRVGQLKPNSLYPKGSSSSHMDEDSTKSRENGEIGYSYQGSLDTVLGQRLNTKMFFIASKIKKMYRKHKSLRKKYFPWSYDWHREDTCVDVKLAEQIGPIRRCKSGVIDHDAVLRAMARALERTEEAYMRMVEKALDKNPELALMGSCVLVMLMKDQDVFVMNLGDSRVILAQERPNDRHSNLNFLKDDVRHRNKSKESLMRMELDRISEESPIHNQNNQVKMIDKNREISICRLKMRAIQLSSDHSTSIEEVCFPFWVVFIMVFFFFG